jgi:16S rRNA (uracil1498-N3)-methyltransferase
VLRISAGEEIDVVEPGGRAWRVRVTEATGGGVLGEVERELPAQREPRVTLIQGIAKGEKMDAIVRQATELGVEEIVPLAAERCVVRLSAPRAAEKTERWRRIALAAAKQCKRASVPRIAEVATLADLPAWLATADVAIVAWEEHEGTGIARVLAERAASCEARVAVVIGPEGGLSEAEVERLKSLGAVAVSLGPTILRAETAAVAALAVTMAALQDRGCAGG